MGSLNKAFSLIELMVVIAVVAVLAAVSVPAYQIYTTKAKLSSLIPTLEVYKNKSLEFYNKTGAWPASITDLGVATTTSLNTDLITAFGVCPSPNGCFGAIGANGDYAGDYGFFLRADPTKLKLPASATAPTLVFDAEVSGTSIVWYCTTDSVTFSAAQNIAKIYLPGNCVSPD